MKTTSVLVSLLAACLLTTCEATSSHRELVEWVMRQLNCAPKTDAPTYSPTVAPTPAITTAPTPAPTKRKDVERDAVPTPAPTKRSDVSGVEGDKDNNEQINSSSSLGTGGVVGAAMAGVALVAIAVAVGTRRQWLRKHAAGSVLSGDSSPSMDAEVAPSSSMEDRGSIENEQGMDGLDQDRVEV